MACYKTHSEQFINDIKKLLKALSDKEAVAQSEVDAFMENCAKRWQTRDFLGGAHAVRARSSDGHKNVLSLIGYSHLLENR